MMPDAIAAGLTPTAGHLADLLTVSGWAEIVADLADPAYFETTEVHDRERPWAVRRTAYDIRSFGDLHDHCDANTYASLCDEWLSDMLDDDEWLTLGNVVQCRLHARLAAGDHLDLTTDYYRHRQTTDPLEYR